MDSVVNLETRRLETLKKLNLQRTPAEDRFNRITRLACLTFAVPISMLSLVGRDSMSVKSSQGIMGAELPRNVTFCDTTISRDAMLVVEDAREAACFKDLPLVNNSPFIRFYAGCPLHWRGEAVGTLCIVDTVPRTFAAADRATLKDLAVWAENELNTRRINDTQQRLIESVDVETRRRFVDESTLAWNREGFDWIFPQDASHCRLANLPLALLNIALDNFGAHVQKLGSEKATLLLKEICQRLQMNLRPEDLIAFDGGDEFKVLLLGASQSAARKVEAKLVACVGSRPFELAGCSVNASISVGGIWVGDWSDTTIALMQQQADDALVAARVKGRNGSVLYG